MIIFILSNVYLIISGRKVRIIWNSLQTVHSLYNTPYYNKDLDRQSQGPVYLNNYAISLNFTELYYKIILLFLAYCKHWTGTCVDNSHVMAPSF